MQRAPERKVADWPDYEIIYYACGVIDAQRQRAHSDEYRELLAEIVARLSTIGRKHQNDQEALRDL